MADNDYYTKATCKTYLAITDATDDAILDQFGIDAKVDTDNFLRPYAPVVPVPLADVTNDIKARTNYLVCENYAGKYIHRYKQAMEFKKNREEAEKRIIASYAAQAGDKYKPVAYSQDYRSEPLQSRSG